MYKEKDILHETANFWVLGVGDKGFEVYEMGATHSTRVARIGHATEGQANLGLPGAIAECERREKLRAQKLQDQQLQTQIRLARRTHTPRASACTAALF